MHRIIPLTIAAILAAPTCNMTPAPTVQDAAAAPSAPPPWPPPGCWLECDSTTCIPCEEK